MNMSPALIRINMVCAYCVLVCVQILLPSCELKSKLRQEVEDPYHVCVYVCTHACVCMRVHACICARCVQYVCIRYLHKVILCIHEVIQCEAKLHSLIK